MRTRLIVVLGCLILCPAIEAFPALQQAAPSQTSNQQSFDPEGFPLPKGALYRIGSMRLRDPLGIYDFTLIDGGKTLLTAGVDDVIRFWDLNTGKVKRAIRVGSAKDVVDHISLSPHGNVAMAQVNTGQSYSKPDGKFIFVDVASGREIKKLNTSAAPIFNRELSPDGSRIAISTWLKDDPLRARVTLQERATGKEREASLHVANAQGSVITGGSFAPNSKWYVVCGFGNDPCRVLDLATGAEVCRLGKWNVESATFSTDSKLLVLSCLPEGEADNKPSLRLIKMPGGELMARFPMQATLGSIALSHDGKLLAGSADELCLFDIATGVIRQRFGTPADKLLFSADDKMLVSRSGKLILLFDVATAKEISGRDAGFHVNGPPDPVMAPDAKTLAFIDGRILCITLWDLSKAQSKRRLPISERDLTGMHQLVFRDNGTRISAIGQQGSLLTWNVATGKEEKRFELHDSLKGGSAHFPHLSDDGRNVAMILPPAEKQLENSPNQLKIWDASSGSVVRNIAVPNQWWHCQWMPDGKSMLLGSSNEFMLVNAANGAEQARFKATDGLYELHPSRDGRLLAAGREKTAEIKDLTTWERLTGKEVARLPVGLVRFGSREIWADDRSLITVNETSIKVWDLDTRQVRYQLSLEYETAGIKQNLQLNRALLFGNGRQLFTSLADGSALVWDLAPAFPPSKRFAERPTDRELSERWSDLGSEDARRAYQAVWRLEEMPRSWPFVIEQLVKDKVDHDSQKARVLAARLESQILEVRQKAVKDLEAMGGAAVPALREIRARTKLTDLQQRLDQLLGDWPASTMSALTLRRLRALQILEHADTVESRQALAALTKDPFSEREADEARSALERIERAAKVKPLN